MNLPEAAIIEFQKIYQKKFNVLLDFNEAEIRAEKFLRLMALLTIGSQNENEKLYQNTK